MKKNRKTSDSRSMSAHNYIIIALILLSLLILAMATPVSASAPEITAIKQGLTSGMALDENSVLWYWGSNFLGESGEDGDITASYYEVTPVKVDGIRDAVSMDGGTYFSVVLDKNHAVWTWGDGQWGGLGRNYSHGDSSTHSPTPRLVPGMTGVKMVSTGSMFCSVLLDNGTVWTWGYNSDGQLGDGKKIILPHDQEYFRPYPDIVAGLNNVKYIATGPNNVIAITIDGKLWVWGATNVLLPGDYGKRNYQSLITTGGMSTPINIDGIRDVESVGVGEHSAVALKDDGTVWTWGANHFGQLGNSESEYAYDPAVVPGLSNIIQISAGDRHVLALGDDGIVWSWGYNQYGQIGDGTATDRYTPVKLDLPKITAISAKGYNSMALDENGVVWTWGYNQFGQLGNGKQGDGVYSPVPGKVIFADSPGDDPDPTPGNDAGNATISPGPSVIGATPGFGWIFGLAMLIVAALARNNKQRRRKQ